MKMKRFIVLLAVTFSALFILVACGGDDASEEKPNDAQNSEQSVGERVSGADMQDGTYALEEQNFDENGWKVFMEITVEDGKITESNYNYKDEDDNLKTDDEEYQDMMKDQSGVGPQEFVEQLNKGLVSMQDAQLVDVVSGATHSSEVFINYAQQLIQAAQNGQSDTILIHNGEALQDGEYSLVEKNYDANDWKVSIKIVIDSGKIVESDYNYVNADGELKTEDDGYQEFMEGEVGVGPQDYIPTLNDELVEKQDPAEVDIVSGATTSAESFKNYAAQLVNASQKGDTEEIVVDNFVYEEE